MGEPVIHGHCDEKFARIRDTFDQNMRDGLEMGAAFALSVDGEMVVDLWAGDASLDGSKQWTKDTLVPVASSSKIPVSICGLMLLDRGLIDLDEPVAKYWPEFAANGKQDLPVRYIFCHATGLPGLDGMPGWDVINDFDEVCRRLAAQKPWWEPGTVSGYQGYTYGNLIGELVRRTTRQSIEAFFSAEIAKPFGIDFHFGCPDTEEHRLTEIDDEDLRTQKTPDKTLMSYRAGEYAIIELISDPGMHMWKLNAPAINGVTNARALAKLGSVLALGGSLKGQKLIGERVAALPYKEQIYTTDLIFQAPVRYGVGFGMASKEIPLPWEKSFHWGGRGGSTAVMIPEERAAWAYTPNRLMSGVLGDPRSGVLGAATVKSFFAKEEA